VTIISRAGWGARPPNGTPTPTTVTELYLHHSVGSGTVDKDGDGDKGDDYMRAMQTFHMDVRGWDDIAYNHAHDPDGREFYEGRGFGIRPGSQANHNTGTHSLAVMGDYRTQPVSGQLRADIARFYYEAQAAGLLPRVPVRGHRDAPAQSTTCPGDRLYAALPEINALIDQLHEEDEMSSPKAWDAADAEAFGSILNNVIVKHTELNLAWHLRNTLLGVQRLVEDLSELGEEELAAIAKAVNDELARRQQG
jgi:N-acetylmuramoyl-L-alanine amidase